MNIVSCGCVHPVCVAAATLTSDLSTMQMLEFDGKSHGHEGTARPTLASGGGLQEPLLPPMQQGMYVLQNLDMKAA
jgi:hypothetical protein